MSNLSTSKSGFTIVEVLISLGLMLIFLPFAASMIINSQVLASYAKHKTQAAYAAQQIIETQRQNTFVTLSAGQSKVLGPYNVLLDTKGNYNNTCPGNGTTGAFCGTAVVTLTPSVYNNGSVTITSATTDHLVVQIYWNEKIGNSFIPMTETYAEDIVNDPMLN